MKPEDLENGTTRLIDFMARGQVPPGMRKNEYLSLANDIYDLLLAEGTAAQQLLDHAFSVIPDTQSEPVWRDYCIQKLAPTLSHPAVAPGSVLPGLDLLERLIDGEFPELQGVALIAASQLQSSDIARRHNVLTPAYLGKQALRCASDAKSPLPDRVTALQIAGRYLPGKTQGYAGSLLAAEQQDTAVMLKISAIATLGQIGNETHLPLIRSYRRSADIRLRKAARVAIERLGS